MRIMNLRTVLHTEVPEHSAVILITGPFSGGKSSFIHSICERIWPLIEFDEVTAYYAEGEDVISGRCRGQGGLGEIRIGDDISLLLLESPGARRFDYVFEMTESMEGFFSAVVIFDSARPETFKETRSILDTFRAYPPVPYVVVASRQDHPEAWNLDDLRIALRLKDDVRLMSCVATRRDSVKQVMLALLEMLRAERAITKILALPDSNPPDITDTDDDSSEANATQPASSDRFEELVAELFGADPLRRGTAAWSLGRLQDERAIAPLIAVLNDNEQLWDTLNSAALALANLGGKV